MDNMDNSKTYPAHMSRRFGGTISGILLGVLIAQTFKKNVDYELLLSGFFIFIAVEFLIFVVQFTRGRYARVSFSEEGFTCIKYFRAKFVSWEKVYKVEDGNPFFSILAYYMIKADDDGKEKEYLIEKNYKTKLMMEKYYLKSEGFERTIRLASPTSQGSGFFVSLIAMIIIAVYATASLGYNKTITMSNMLWIFAAIAAISALAAALYFFFSKNDSCKVNRLGVKIKLNERDYIFSWHEIKEVRRKREQLGEKYNHILTLMLKDKIAGEYDIIEVPVRERFAEKLGEEITVVVE